jgi:hypothetical protein
MVDDIGRIRNHMAKAGHSLSALLGCVGILSLPAFGGPVDDLETWLKAARAARPALASQSFADAPLSAAECARARDLIWADRVAFVKSEWGAQWSARQLVDGNGFKMPFDYRIYGSKPAAGYDLYISMHGGGETDKATNDQQWQNQILLYRPKGIYLAPRAPTDTWNMWHRDHIDGFFDRIIQLCVANLGANVNRVYLTGYSAGGDGTYQMAPRMADRWAAAAMMAGYPNNASPINLRNIGFSMHVGALDAAYNRNTIAVTYGKEIQKLQDADPGFYKYEVQVHAGKPHWMDLEDSVALHWTFPFTRRPNPSKVVWHQDTTVGTNSFPAGGQVQSVKGHTVQFQFHWIGLQERKPLATPALVTAEIKGQDVSILSSNVDSLLILLNDSLLDLDKDVRVLWQGKPVYSGKVPRTAANLYGTVNDRGDREYAYPVSIPVWKKAQVGIRAAGYKAPARLNATLRSGVLDVEVEGAPAGSRLRVVDARGRILWSGTAPQGGSAAAQKFEIPVAGWGPGLYRVAIRAPGKNAFYALTEMRVRL